MKKSRIWVQLITVRASLVAQSVKNLPAVQETQVQFLGWEDPLEKEMATHSSILAWKIPWTEAHDHRRWRGDYQLACHERVRRGVPRGRARAARLVRLNLLRLLRHGCFEGL